MTAGRCWALAAFTAALLLGPAVAGAQPVTCTSADVADLGGEAPSPFAAAKVLQGAAATVEAITAPRDAPVIVRGAKLAGADFSGRRVEHICFEDSDLAGSKWRAATLRHVAFADLELADVELEGARLEDVRLLNTRLRGLRAPGSTWRRVVLAGGGLGTIDMRGATLVDVQRRCGALVGEYFCTDSGKVDLTGASIDRLQFDGYLAAQLGGAVVRHARLQPVQIPAFAEARIEGGVVLTGPGGRISKTLSPAEWSVVKDLYARPDAGVSLDGAPRRVRPGETLVFAGKLPVLSPAFRRSALFKRLVPLMLDSSASQLIVMGQADGRVSILGGAAGANGHSCTAEAEDLTLGADGWYGRATVDQPWVQVVRLIGDVARLQDAHAHPGSEFVGCGARASFADMRLLPVDATRVRERLTGEGIQ